MQILDGKRTAEARRENLKPLVAAYAQNAGRPPGLAMILVGDDPASQIYVANKVKACGLVGIKSTEVRLPETTTAAQLKATIEGLNHDPEIDAILLQLPLPPSFANVRAIEWIAPKKDVDCLTNENMGLLWGGHRRVAPCTPAGVMAILENYGVPIAGRDAVVIGRSNIVGKPMAYLLSEANATVTICHSQTRDLRRFTSAAEIVVVAAGRPEFLGRDDFKNGAVVIDVGIHRKFMADGKTKLCGDVRWSELEGHLSAATPVPGGVGPMTIAMLLENTLSLAVGRNQV